MPTSSRTSNCARQGFTLAEVLVSITLVAVLGAVVVPTVAGQIKKGDPTRMGNDFLAVRGGVEQFLSDVRRYPNGVSQLTAAISTSDAPLAGTATSSYGAAEVTRWRGPYLSKDGTAALLTGFGLKMNAVFDTVTLAANGVQSGAGNKYMVLSVPMAASGTAGNDSLSILRLDQQFDDGVLTSGVIRYRICASTSCGSSPDTIKFLVMPIS
jgi:prepilin-type N-terminal cleavage/methylation domain-containing protein